MDNQKELGSWDNYISLYLKAEDVKNPEEDVFLVEEVKEMDDNGKYLELKLNYAGVKYLFSLNKTNSRFFEKEGVEPNQIKGKILKFKKVLAYNPTEKKEVNSLRICQVIDRSELSKD